ncbi:ArsR/SmtB family transcription factor [Gemmatimonadota bacterium]
MRGARKIVEPESKKYELEAELLSLLGQSTRLRLLAMLRDGELCVCEIHPAMPEDQSVISRHLGKLRQMGILESRREGVSVFYRIIEPGVFAILDLADEILLSSRERQAEEALRVL